MPELSEVKVKISTESDDKGIKEAEKSFKGFSESTTQASNIILGVFAGATTAAIAFGAKAFGAYAEAEAAQRQLEHAVIAVTGATKEQMEQTASLADALEKKGVLDGDNIKIGLAQLSTFGLSNKAVQALGGSLADLAVNQFGVSASGDQLSQSANMIAKALNGQFGVLEKSGIRFTELQKAIIANGTETEKVAAIQEGFAQNLKYTNDVAATTSEGGLARLQVQLGNIEESVGKFVSESLNPLINTLATNVGPAFDSLVNNLKNVFSFIEKNQGLIPIIAGTIMALLIPALVGLAGSIWLVLGPLLAFAAPIIAIGALIGALYVAWNNNFLGIRDITDSVVNFFNTKILPILVGVFNAIKFYLTLVWDFWVLAFNAIKILLDLFGTWFMKTFGTQIDAVFKFISSGVDTLKKFWDGIWTGMGSTVSGIASQILGYVKNLVNGVIGFFNTLINGANKVGDKVPGFVHIPNIPQFADGVSNFGGGMAIVGEQGPEIVNLPRGSSVIPNNKIGSTGGQTINQTNYIYNTVDMDLALNNLAYALAKQ